MSQHMILMCSDYVQGERIAFHKCYSKVSGILKFEDIANEVKEKFTNIEFSFHHIPTNSRIKQSIAEYDSYFKDVIFYSDLDEFEENIKMSTKLTPEDIAKYILCQYRFDQLQVQKLLYFVYEEFSKSYDTPLFEEKFEAWQYGPVIPQIYGVLNKYKSEKIDLADKELERIKLGLKFEKVEDSDVILSIVDKVLLKYGCKTGSELIEETHCQGSPWDITIKERGMRSNIPFELVRKCARTVNQ